MKKTIKAIGVIATMGIMLVSAYLLGTTQAETITETVTEIQTVTETREVIPDGYISLDEINENFVDMRMVVNFESNGDSLQLYFKDGSGYYIER